MTFSRHFWWAASLRRSLFGVTLTAVSGAGWGLCRLSLRWDLSELPHDQSGRVRFREEDHGAKRPSRRATSRGRALRPSLLA